ncbi:MAG: tetratricopeptide repeat protein [Burkholderiaceae bacterium]
MKSSIAPALLLLLALTGGLPAHAQETSQTRDDAGRPARQQALELAKIRDLIDRKRPRDAVLAAEAAMKRFPENTQLRFLLGVAQTDAGQAEQAIATFEALNRDHPELAEPYNNLAVLHASRGDLINARAALEQAVRVVPDYGLAYENLGDVYLRLTVEAYERASNAAKPSRPARKKLTLTRQLLEQLNPAP